MTTTYTINGFQIRTLDTQAEILQLEQNPIPCIKPWQGGAATIAPYRNGEIAVMAHDNDHYSVITER